MPVLNSMPARVAAVLLLLQAGAYYAVAYRSERIPAVAPLRTFPASSGEWTAEREYPLEPEVQDVLKADDTLSRIYVHHGGNGGASLFIAFFRTQRYGQSPHSPKNCMPGSGWQAQEDQPVPVSVPGRDQPIVVNRYVVSRGEQSSVVLYWYQSHNRVIARELAAKLWLVADAVRYHRSDTALVRIVVPVTEGRRDLAASRAMDFARAVYPDLVRALPQ